MCLKSGNWVSGSLFDRQAIETREYRIEQGNAYSFIASLFRVLSVRASGWSASNWAERGSALKAAGNIDGAIEAFQKALQLDPGSARLEDEIGFLLAAKGNRTLRWNTSEAPLAWRPRLLPRIFILESRCGLLTISPKAFRRSRRLLILCRRMANIPTDWEALT